MDHIIYLINDSIKDIKTMLEWDCDKNYIKETIDHRLDIFKMLLEQLRKHIEKHKQIDKDNAKDDTYLDDKYKPYNVIYKIYCTDYEYLKNKAKEMQ